MPNVFNQLLGAMSGGFTGYEQEQDKHRVEARQAQNDLYLNEDRASQRALRDAQAGTATQRAAQDAYLRTPEFQSLYQQARGGDEGAIAKVASAVAGHPDASTFMGPLTREPKEFAPLATPTGYVGRNGVPLFGQDGKPIMPMATMPKPDPVQIIQGTNGPDGTPQYFRVPKAGGPATPVEGITPKPTSASGQTSAQAALAMQRLGMSLSDVQGASDRMTAAENDPEFRKLLTVGNQMGMNAADVKPDIHASGFLGAVNNAGGSLVSGLAQSHLDDRLNTYRRDKETVGTAMTEVLPRPNQQLLQIEKGLSGIDVGWNPQLIGSAQNRRAQGILQLRKALGALEAGRGGAQAPGATQPGPASAPSGNVDLGAKPSLAQRAQQLKSQGISKDAARAQLQQEGYDLGGGN